MLIILFGVVVLGTAMQAATGFGFALVAAPALYAALEPEPAVGLLCLLAPTMNVLTLTTERRRPHPLMAEVKVLVGWAMPGALVGVLVLRSFSEVALQVLLSVGVAATLVIRHLLTRREAVVPVQQDGPRPRPAWSAPVAGVLAGALGTSVSTNGPPLLLHLLGRGARPSVVRDTLTVCFLCLGLVTPVALLVTWTTEAIPELEHVLVLLPAVLTGHYIGRHGFARLARSDRYEQVVTAVLAVSVTVGLGTVLL